MLNPVNRNQFNQSIHSQLRKKVHILLVILLFGMSTELFSQRNLTKQQQEFVNFLLPLIDQANDEIARQRTGIYSIYQDFKKNQAMSPTARELIFSYAELYKLKIPDDTTGVEFVDQHFKELLKRVDIIPKKLVLAQAAIESDWGRSRFVKEGNNYFGIQCYVPGCGVKANQARDKNFWVKAYPSAIDCVRDYMLLLNSSKYYRNFRDLRIVNRLNTALPDPFYIVKGLENYSVKGREYINSLIMIMRVNFFNL